MGGFVQVGFPETEPKACPFGKADATGERLPNQPLTAGTLETVSAQHARLRL
jgi:hypothetical protein